MATFPLLLQYLTLSCCYHSRKIFITQIFINHLLTQLQCLREVDAFTPVHSVSSGSVAFTLFDISPKMHVMVFECVNTVEYVSGK